MLIEASYAVDGLVRRTEKGSKNSLKRYLINNRVYPMNIVKTSRDHSQYMSFRIRIINNSNSNSYVKNVLRADFWP